SRRSRSQSMTTRARWIIAAVCALIGTGCLGGRLPPRELYRLTLPDSARAEPPRVPPTITIAIVPYATPGLYGDPSIVYRLNESEYGAYPWREWAMPLSTMLGLLTQDVLRTQQIAGARALFDPPSRRSATYVWEGTVREFEEIDRPPRVYAAVRLDVRVVRNADNVVVWTGTARREREVIDSKSMPAIVQNLSLLAADAVASLANEAHAVLATPAVSAGRP